MKPWFGPDSSDTANTTYVRHTEDGPTGVKTDGVTVFAKEAMTDATQTHSDAAAEKHRGSWSASSKVVLRSGFNRTAGRTPEQLVSSHEFRRDIVKSIRALSPTLRDTLLLTQSGDYTYAEIGTMLCVPLGTIKWRVAEARRLVKKRLRELGHGELG